MSAPSLTPRGLSKAHAAAYCGLSQRAFDEWVTTGKLPGPMAGTRHWDKVAVDRALDKLSGLGGEAAAVAVVEVDPLAKWRRGARNSA